MPDLKASPKQSPFYNQHRELSVANDTLPETEQKHGCNTSGYRFVMIQVVPSGDANPDVEVLWWSESAGRFISQNPALSYSGVGPNEPYEFTIEALGRVLYVAITDGNGVGANLTKVFVSGDVLRAQ